jgi:hypothetical protein
MPPDDVKNAEIVILDMLQHSVISTDKETLLKPLQFPKNLSFVQWNGGTNQSEVTWERK